MKKRILILIFILIYIILIANYVISLNRKNFLLFGTTTFVYYDNNNNIKKIKYTKKINKSLDYEQFNVYLDNKFNKYYINFYDQDNATFYDLYNNLNEKISSKELLLAYKGNIKINVSSTKFQNEMPEDERNKLLNILKTNSINEDINIYSRQTLDLNNDSKKENIYTISNYGGKINKVIYSYVFIEDSDGNITNVKLLKNENVNTAEINQVYHIWSIDLDNDKNYEIVLSQTKGDDSPVYYEFYKYDSNKKVNQILK